MLCGATPIHARPPIALRRSSVSVMKSCACGVMNRACPGFAAFCQPALAYARAGWQKAANPGQARFITPHAQDFITDTEDLRKAIGGRAWIGVAPHSIRAVPLDYLHEVAEYARANELPLHMHVAEQPAEVEDSIGEYGSRPVELLAKE